MTKRARSDGSGANDLNNSGASGVGGGGVERGAKKPRNADDISGSGGGVREEMGGAGGGGGAYGGAGAVASEKISEVKKQAEELMAKMVKMAEAYQCPISLEIMSDPWMAIPTNPDQSANSYNQQALHGLFENMNRVDPISGEPLSGMRANQTLRNIIHSSCHEVVQESLKLIPSLFEAGEIETVRALFAKASEMDLSPDKERTNNLVSDAIENEEVDLLRIYLDACPDLIDSYRNPYGHNLLEQAIFSDYVEVCRFLIEERHVACNLDESLDFAAQTLNPEVCQLLVGLGAKVSKEVLEFASSDAFGVNGGYDGNSIAERNFKFLFENRSADISPDEVLRCVVESGVPEACRLLVSLGVKVSEEILSTALRKQESNLRFLPNHAEWHNRDKEIVDFLRQQLNQAPSADVAGAAASGVKGKDGREGGGGSGEERGGGGGGGGSGRI